MSTGPALALVEGEAGIGKTRLVKEFLSDQSLQDSTMVLATCQPLREPFPLGSIVDALRRQPIELAPGRGEESFPARLVA